jgi:putative ABC transport system substrate-binding protein
MKRREFIALLGGASVAWPLAVHAQQQAMPVIGYLRSDSLDGAQHQVAGFRQGLNEAGFIEGQNVAIEFRSAEGHRDRLPALAAELIRRPVAVIVANGVAARAAKAATQSIPIVFVMGGDPVREGLVTSISRPDGNLTGVTFLVSSVSAKRLELLHELVPKATVIAALLDVNNLPGDIELKDIEAAARSLGRELVIAKVNAEARFDEAFAMIVQRRAGALYVGSGPFLSNQRERIVALAARHAIPAVHPIRQFVEIGGLMSYGTSQVDAYRQVGLYAGKILKGAKPSDLPVVQGAKFEFVLNLKTAKTLGLQVPQSLQAAADEVIE